MSTIHYTVGLPGSGKTTWAKKFIAESSEKIVRANRDDLRQMLHDGFFSPENEQMVTKVQEDIIYGALRRGHSVMVDDTNLNPKTLRHLSDIERDINSNFGCRPVALVRHDQFLRVPINVCIERDASRDPFHVGADVIRRMHDRWIAAATEKEMIAR